MDLSERIRDNNRMKKSEFVSGSGTVRDAWHLAGLRLGEVRKHTDADTIKGLGFPDLPLKNSLLGYDTETGQLEYFDIAAGGGVTKHGDLTDLDVDDHLQYIINDGTRGTQVIAGAFEFTGSIKTASLVTGEANISEDASGNMRFYDTVTGEKTLAQLTGKDADGGTATSVYLPTQLIDGGSAGG